MSNTVLTLSHVANIACAVGCDMGFNAAGANAWIDPKTFDRRIAVTFGDAATMRKPMSRMIGDYSLAWTEECSCFRDERVVEVPEHMLEGTNRALSDYLSAQLLELIPSGPSGVKTALEFDDGAA